MRRAIAVLLGTVTGTVLLVGAKYTTAPAATPSAVATGPGDAGAAGSPSGTSPSGSAAAPPSGAATGEASTPPAAGTPPAGGAGAGAGGEGGGNGGGGAGEGGGAQPTPAPTPTTAACTTASGAATTVASPGVGEMTVTVKVCGGVVTNSTGSLSRSNWKRNDQAIPTLDTLAVQYYKTDISKIYYSGATLTANAYRTSLTSAISKAGI